MAEKKIVTGYSVRENLLYLDGMPVSWKKSPNIGGIIRPKLIVIHYTGTNSDQSALNWLTQKGSQVSAHLLISKTGHVWQMVPFNVRAWHAGRSYYDDGEGFETSDVNTWSIGIENTGLGDHWPEAQIEANKGIIKTLYRAYGIIDTVGHEDVAPGRKSDPGPRFPWKKIFPDWEG